jgi:ribosome-associated protein
LAVQQLVDLLQRAAVPPKKRRPTKVPHTAKQKRLENKKRRSDLKRTRKAIRREDDS